MSLHVPGTVAVRANPATVRSALTRADVVFTTIDGADVTVHPAYPPRPAPDPRVGELTIVTFA